MTAPKASFEELLAMAQHCGCSGVELRNDLASSPLVDDSQTKPSSVNASALETQRVARTKGVRIVALAELTAFNQFTDRTRQSARQLCHQASGCGAPGIVLIPANDGSNPSPAARKSQLIEAFSELVPILEEYDVCGFVEPLGFETSTLRFKAEVVELIQAMNVSSRFKLVHDTFHHHLAGEQQSFAAFTGIVHVSGVVDNTLKPSQMQDSHRVLVNEQDQLNTVHQLEALLAEGYQGPVSMEVFAPSVHELPDLADKLRNSYDFINSGLAAMVA